jgi:hypothetical protein
MSDTTLEEAKRCTFCQEPCKTVKEQPLPQGGKMHIYQCENERCTDYQGRRMVQTNPDGSIVQPHSQPKAYAKLNHHAQRSVQAREELRLLEFMSEHPEMTRREAIRALGG